MRRHIATVSSIINVIVLAIIGTWFFSGKQVPWEPPLSRSDFLEITLTALAIMIAAVGIAFGFMAILGYEGIKRGAISVAKSAAQDVATREIRAYIDGQEQNRNRSEEEVKSLLASLNSMPPQGSEATKTSLAAIRARKRRLRKLHSKGDDV